MEAGLGALSIDLRDAIAAADLAVHLPFIGRPAVTASFACGCLKFDGHLHFHRKCLAAAYGDSPGGANLQLVQLHQNFWTASYLHSIKIDSEMDLTLLGLFTGVLLRCCNRRPKQT